MADDDLDIVSTVTDTFTDSGSDGDSFVETTSKGWLTRLGESVMGVVIGFLGVLACIVLLYWNEGRAVDAATALDEGAGSVVSVSPSDLNASRNGKLVHIMGDLTVAAPARDAALGVTDSGLLRLRRVAEMYQWKEYSRSETTTELGGSEKTRTVYEYRRIWTERAIPSDGFRSPNGHMNPAMPITSATFTASGIRLGDFGVAPGLINQLGDFQPITVDPAGPAAKGFRPADDGFYRGFDPAQPRVGDLRLRFEAVPVQAVTVVAGQVNGTLMPFAASNGYEIALIAPGARPAAALFKEAHQGEAMLTWILRVCGFVGVLICLMLLFQPLAVLVSVLPFLETLVGAGAFLISFVLAIPITAITIAVAWFAHRPILAGILVVVALLGFFGLPRLLGTKPVPAKA